MPNLGEKHVEFRTGDGLSSSLLFKLTDTRKPFASVSKIVKKGKLVMFGSDRSYIDNVLTGKLVELTEYTLTSSLRVLLHRNCKTEVRGG